MFQGSYFDLILVVRNYVMQYCECYVRSTISHHTGPITTQTAMHVVYVCLCLHAILKEKKKMCKSKFQDNGWVIFS